MDTSMERMILDFLDGGLTEEDTKKLLQELKEAGVEDDLDLLKSISAELESMEAPEPGPGLNRKFYQMLDTVQARESGRLFSRIRGWLSSRRVRRYSIRFAYGAVLLSIGWFAGRSVPKSITPEIVSLSAQVGQMKKMMTFSMLNQSSPAERIRAIHYMKSLVQTDRDVVQALIETVNTDENVNVRLVALETLINSPRSEYIRSGLLHAALYQDSPLLQLTLVEALLDSRDPDAAEPLRMLLERKDLHYAVRERIESSLIPMSQVTS